MIEIKFKTWCISDNSMIKEIYLNDSNICAKFYENNERQNAFKSN